MCLPCSSSSLILLVLPVQLTLFNYYPVPLCDQIFSEIIQSFVVNLIFCQIYRDKFMS